MLDKQSKNDLNVQKLTGVLHLVGTMSPGTHACSGSSFLDVRGARTESVGIVWN